MIAHIPSQLENILVAAVKKQSEVRRTAHRNRIDELVFSRKPGKKTPYIDSRSESLNGVNHSKLIDFPQKSEDGNPHNENRSYNPKVSLRIQTIHFTTHSTCVELDSLPSDAQSVRCASARSASNVSHSFPSIASLITLKLIKKPSECADS